MRSFRDPLTRLLAAALVLASAHGQAGSAAAAGHPYFPLAVGNSWSYRCSIEGAPGRGKVLRITGQARQGDTLYFRAELKVGSDPKPLVQYFSLGPDGSLRRSLKPEPAAEEVLIGADTQPGSRHGSWTSAGTEALDMPALRRQPALRLENFAIDSPDVPADKRNEWRARYYAKGIGPVGDADGLGGRCDLIRYRVAKPAGGT